MNKSKLDEVTATLVQEEARLLEEVDSIKQGLKAAEDELKQVRAALTALGAKPSGKKTSNSKKRAPSKHDVAVIIAEVLSEHTELEEGDLKAEVEKRVLARGRSRMGLALRFQEALKDKSFEAFVKDSQGWYRIATSSLEEAAT